MKKILGLLMLSMIIFSCTVQRYEIITDGYDLTRFSEQGFLMTTSNISQAYTSVAILNSTCTPGVIKGQEKEVKSQKQKKYEDIYYSSTDVTSGNYKACELSDLLDELHRQAVEAGANALINIEFSRWGTTLSCSGLAVKIEND